MEDMSNSDKEDNQRDTLSENLVGIDDENHHQRVYKIFKISLEESLIYLVTQLYII